MPSETEQWWDSYSAAYQDDCHIPIDIHYGPSSPNEDTLRLLGELEGRDVREIGCCGAQCSIAFALRGARVTGLDLSEQQLEFAAKLAAREGVEIELIQHDISDLELLLSDSRDIVFSAFALQFVQDKARTFREVHRVLRPGGTFVFSVVHPFFRKVDDKTLTVVESYHGTDPMVEYRGDHGGVTVYRYSVGSLHAALVEAGFVVRQIIEPDSRIRYDYDPVVRPPWQILPEDPGLAAAHDHLQVRQGEGAAGVMTATPSCKEDPGFSSRFARTCQRCWHVSALGPGHVMD